MVLQTYNSLLLGASYVTVDPRTGFVDSAYFDRRTLTLRGTCEARARFGQDPARARFGQDPARARFGQDPKLVCQVCLHYLYPQSARHLLFQTF